MTTNHRLSLADDPSGFDWDTIKSIIGGMTP